MKHTLYSTKIFVFFVCVLAFATSSMANATTNEKKQGESTKLIRVEPKKVCMVNDKLFDKDQIPVEVEGRTYYGCCEMCEKALKEGKEYRTAVDPVSGNKVDKSKAVIGALSDGMTLYFENEKSFETYVK